MRIAIIGAGFYGLHIASRLKALGIDITIFERSNNILNFASGNNQFRLHLGFHYARNFRTRQQSRDGYFRFLERYNHLTETISKNYYLVPQGHSLIDFQTYKLIMTSSGLDFTEIDSPPEISYPCGCLLTSERVLMISRARTYFADKLSSSILLNCEAHVSYIGDSIFVNNDAYDYVIDCTWGHLSSDKNFFYESTILLYYRIKSPDPCRKAYTFVDGPLCSLYPTENPEIYTLSSVIHTPICQYTSSSEALRSIQNLSSQVINQKKSSMENQLLEYFPDFLDQFVFDSPQLCVKTKPYGHDDDRSCYVKQDDRIIKCLSGKIDNIFYASNEVISLVEE